MKRSFWVLMLACLTAFSMSSTALPVSADELIGQTEVSVSYEEEEEPEEISLPDEVSLPEEEPAAAEAEQPEEEQPEAEQPDTVSPGTETGDIEETDISEAEAEEDLVQESGTPVISYQTHVQTYGWQDYVQDGAMSGTNGEAKRLEGIRIKVDGVDGLGVEYRTHVQTYGWQEYVKDGMMSGTNGESKRLEGIRIKVDGVEGLGVEYRTHVQTYGWQEYVHDGDMAGTSGQSKRLEAINIRLTGEKAAEYDVYYCVHVQTFGWLGWAKNNEMAGTAGYAKRLEGIMIRILPKGAEAPAPVGTIAIPSMYANIEYQTHVQTYGWQGYVSNGAVSGTTGQSKRLEGIRIRLGDCSVPGSVRYRTHVQTYGWESGYVSDNAMSGTSGQSKRLEAIEIALEGEIAKYFDVYYRTHVQRYGWTDWAKNGQACGSEGCSYRLEGIQIRLVPKGNAAPGATANILFTRTKAQNDMFSRAQSFYSATDWLILTNVTTHIVGVFHWNGSYWDLYKEFLSSTGAPWSPTVEGEFIVQAKILYFGTYDYRCWYATQFYGDYLFHSVLYNVADGPYTVQDGRLGMAISHGCVRMNLEDAKWIYDNIPSGTKVYVYH